MMERFWPLLPGLLAVVTAGVTRQVLPALFLGLGVGSWLMAPGIAPATRRFLSYLVEAATDPENFRVIIFIYTFSGLVGMMQISGGIKGLAGYIAGKVKNARQVGFATWLTLPLTFFDCEFRSVAVIPLMSELGQKKGLKKGQLGILLDASTVPVIALLPAATTYVGYMVAVLRSAMGNQALGITPYGVFLRSLPLNFFSWGVIILALGSTFLNKYPAGASGEGREEKDKDHGENPAHEALEEAEKDEIRKVPPRAFNLYIPVLLITALTAYFLWGGRGEGITGATSAMLVAIFLTVAVMVVLYRMQGISLAEQSFHFVHGGNEIMMAIIMLVLVWGLEEVSADLGFHRLVRTIIGGRMGPSILPPTIFLLAAGVSYLIGTSWGTWGLVMPLAISLAIPTGTPLALAAAAVFAGGTFGDFASPVSETTVTTAALLGMGAVEHARNKKPYALGAGVLATVFFLLAGIIRNVR